jgi:tetratricopeptide (TPR) repeat protein
MSALRRIPVLSRLLLALVLTPLLGLSPRPHQADASLESARRAAASGAYLQAAGHVGAAAGRLPGRADLWELAGSYALQGGDPLAAIRYLEAVPMDKLHAEAQIALGDAYQQTGNLPAAIRAWQAALSAQKYTDDIYARLWKAYFDEGDYANAISNLRNLATRHPEDAQLQYRLGLLVATQQPESALASLAQAAKMDASLSQAVDEISVSITSARRAEDPTYSLLSAGRALANLDEWALAEEAFYQASQARPDYAEAWVYLGEACQHASARRCKVDGLSELQQGLKLDPTSLSGNTFLALYWRRLGHFDQALAVLEEATRLDENNPVLLSELGNTYAAQGDLQSASQAYLQAVDAAPNDVTFLRLCAEFSLKHEFEIHELALPLARRAVILAPGDPDSLDTMAQVLIKLNDLVNAERFLLRALGADPNSALAHLHLGLVYLLRNENGRAAQEIDLARSLDPNGPAADQAQRLLQSYFP